MKTHSTYQCETCERFYKTPGAAKACEDQPDTVRLVEPGDIALARLTTFGWFDGDPAWVAYGNEEDGTLAFFYYVGAVEIRRRESGGLYLVDGEDNVKADGEYVFAHQWAYHVFTQAMKKGYREGWTCSETHITPIRVEDPPELPGTEEFVGKRSEILL